MSLDQRLLARNNDVSFDTSRFAPKQLPNRKTIKKSASQHLPNTTAPNSRSGSLTSQSIPYKGNKGGQPQQRLQSLRSVNQQSPSKSHFANSHNHPLAAPRSNSLRQIPNGAHNATPNGNITGDNDIAKRLTRAQRHSKSSTNIANLERQNLRGTPNKNGANAGNFKPSKPVKSMSQASFQKPKQMQMNPQQFQPNSMKSGQLPPPQVTAQYWSQVMQHMQNQNNSGDRDEPESDHAISSGQIPPALAQNLPPQFFENIPPQYMAQMFSTMDPKQPSSPQRNSTAKVKNSTINKDTINIDDEDDDDDNSIQIKKVKKLNMSHKKPFDYMEDNGSSVSTRSSSHVNMASLPNTASSTVEDIEVGESLKLDNIAKIKAEREARLNSEKLAKEEEEARLKTKLEAERIKKEREEQRLRLMEQEKAKDEARKAEARERELKQKALKEEAEKQLQLKLEQERKIQLEEERLKKEMLESERKAQLAKIEAQKIAADKLAAKKRAEQEEEAERARLAAKAVEEKRIAEEARVAEAKRLAEENRAAEEKLIAEKNKAIEANRIAENERIASEKRAAEEKRLIEEQKLLKDQQLAEQRKLENFKAGHNLDSHTPFKINNDNTSKTSVASESRSIDEVKKQQIQSARQAQKIRLEEERSRKLEEERKVQAALKVEEARREEEAKRLEDLSRKRKEDELEIKKQAELQLLKKEGILSKGMTLQQEKEIQEAEAKKREQLLRKRKEAEEARKAAIERMELSKLEEELALQSVESTKSVKSTKSSKSDKAKSGFSLKPKKSIPKNLQSSPVSSKKSEEERKQEARKELMAARKAEAELETQRALQEKQYNEEVRKTKEKMAKSTTVFTSNKSLPKVPGSSPGTSPNMTTTPKFHDGSETVKKSSSGRTLAPEKQEFINIDTFDNIFAPLDVSGDSSSGDLRKDSETSIDSSNVLLSTKKEYETIEVDSKGSPVEFNNRTSIIDTKTKNLFTDYDSMFSPMSENPKKGLSVINDSSDPLHGSETSTIRKADSSTQSLYQGFTGQASISSGKNKHIKPGNFPKVPQMPQMPQVPIVDVAADVNYNNAEPEEILLFEPSARTDNSKRLTSMKKFKSMGRKVMQVGKKTKQIVNIDKSNNNSNTLDSVASSQSITNLKHSFSLKRKKDMAAVQAYEPPLAKAEEMTVPEEQYDQDEAFETSFNPSPEPPVVALEPLRIRKKVPEPLTIEERTQIKLAKKRSSGHSDFFNVENLTNDADLKKETKNISATPETAFEFDYDGFDYLQELIEFGIEAANKKDDGNDASDRGTNAASVSPISSPITSSETTPTAESLDRTILGEQSISQKLQDTEQSTLVEPSQKTSSKMEDWVAPLNVSPKKSCLKKPKGYTYSVKKTCTVSFSNSVHVSKTFSKFAYDRESDKNNTCCYLHPALIEQIKQELNDFKKEMPVHEDSKVYTHFFY